MKAAPLDQDASTQEHNARVMRDWRGHKEMAAFKSTGWRKGEYHHVLKFSDNSNVKPEKPTKEMPGTALSIWVRHLTTGTCHRERWLSGVVIEDAIFTGGIYFVMKDAIGDLVKIGVYNIPNASPAAAAHRFPCGKCVTIVEPYLKTGIDGSAFVRVDDPATDVLTDSHVLPGCDAAAWQLEGNQLFAANMTAEAFECWSRALSFAAASSTVSTLLTNRAAALLRSGHPAEAARDCFVALTIDPLQVKAAGRLVDALSALGLDEVAKTYAQGFVERWPELKSYLQTHLWGARHSDWSRVAAETLWWENDIVSAVLFIQPELADKYKDVRWDQLKALGNDLFRSGSFNGAAKVYSHALAYVDGVDVLVKLLCNRAAAAMKDENHLSALTNATASLVLDPSNVKSWYRRASALSELDMKKVGLAACTHAIKLLKAQGKNNLAFVPLIKAMTEAETASSQMSPQISTAEQKKMLKEIKDREAKKGCMGTQQLLMLNLIMNLTPEAVKIELFGHKILPMPPFPLELAKHRGWPKGVDIEWAKSHLHFVFEQCSSLPYSMQLGFSGETFEFPPEDLLKRANGQPARLKWLLSNKELKFGDVMPEELVGAITHPQFLRQPFTNQAYRQELLSLGTVHVAVGFVDLGVLLSCDVGEAPKGRTGPLRFVGVELSCFAVAKSLAIWQMIKDAANSKTSADAILQVWFSSTWLPSTHDSFRSAARAVRSQGDKLYGSNGSVSKLLEHWAASRGISLKRARTEWAETVTRGGSGIGNMKQLDDRLDLAAYELTGDVFVGDSAQLTGSICWWDCPDGTPANQFDQTFLSAINVAIVLKERSSGQSFFHAAESFLLRRVAKLITWAGSGAITVEVLIGNVSELVPQIAALNPWTITWSNVSDYYKTSEFHSIARACSVNCDTLHFAYSMNWSTDVAGSHIMDYAAVKRKELFETGYEAMERLYQGLDFKGVFRYPPPENPMNIVDHALAKFWHRKWIDSFFTIARRDGPCQVGNVELATLNPLTHTGNNTLFFTFTYDPEISLHPREQGDDSFLRHVSTMSVKELTDMIRVLSHEEDNMRISGDFLSTAERMHFDQIPRMIEEMKKRLQGANKK
jgi:tetratricopeptide (TPR) repeat protein